MKQVFLALMLGGALMAQLKTDAPKAAPKTAPPANPGAPKRSTAPKTPAPSPGNLLDPSTLRQTAPAVYRTKLTTTKGDVVIEITRAWAPRGADRFYNLVRAGYFTDAPFFRVVPNFMAQFGISARPEVNKAFRGADLIDDPANKISNKRGKLTFATTGRPNSRGTQLFINIGDNAYLDAQGFVPVGEVVEGMALVDQFYTGYGDTASQEDVIENGGKAYTDKNMPKLDRILTATIVPVPPPAAAPAAAAPAATK